MTKKIVLILFWSMFFIVPVGQVIGSDNPEKQVQLIIRSDRMAHVLGDGWEFEYELKNIGTDKFMMNPYLVSGENLHFEFIGPNGQVCHEPVISHDVSYWSFPEHSAELAPGGMLQNWEQIGPDGQVPCVDQEGKYSIKAIAEPYIRVENNNMVKLGKVVSNVIEIDVLSSEHVMPASASLSKAMGIALKYVSEQPYAKDYYPYADKIIELGDRIQVSFIKKRSLGEVILHIDVSKTTWEAKAVCGR